MTGGDNLEKPCCSATWIKVIGLALAENLQVRVRFVKQHRSRVGIQVSKQEQGLLLPPAR